MTITEDGSSKPQPSVALCIRVFYAQFTPPTRTRQDCELGITRHAKTAKLTAAKCFIDDLIHDEYHVTDLTNTTVS